jgi:hypothetical protein
MEAVRSSETSMDFYRNTRRHMPENSMLHSDSCEDIKSNKLLNVYEVNFVRIFRQH